ncbi:hypothetical protein SUDANB15_02617 [Streptomyces sp. enrichment culture]|uniref:hypothetical protein n=1 Tax=Streptomyces sp. enrichment culture TaxID=1795815 RepID=UPI003F561195
MTELLPGQTPKGLDTHRDPNTRHKWRTQLNRAFAEKFGFDGNTIAVFNVLADAANADGTSVTLSAKTISERTGIKSLTRVREILTYGCEAGVLLRVFRPRGRTSKPSAFWLTFATENHYDLAKQAASVLGLPVAEVPRKLGADLLKFEQSLPKWAREKTAQARRKLDRKLTLAELEELAEPLVAEYRAKRAAEKQRTAQHTEPTATVAEVQAVPDTAVTEKKVFQWPTGVDSIRTSDGAFVSRSTFERMKERLADGTALPQWRETVAEIEAAAA